MRGDHEVPEGSCLMLSGVGCFITREVAEAMSESTHFAEVGHEAAEGVHDPSKRKWITEAAVYNAQNELDQVKRDAQLVKARQAVAQATT